ncbi:MAG: DUF3574 domain-containing protein [Acidobacteriota bacterium]
MNQHRFGSLVLGLSLLALCTACASTQPERPSRVLIHHDDGYVTTELFFGLSIPGGGVVTEEDWQHFVDTVITPRFQSGITVLDARGQWFEQASQKVVQEGSKVVILIHQEDQDTTEAIEEIKNAYIETFHQEAVMEVDQDSEVQF